MGFLLVWLRSARLGPGRSDLRLQLLGEFGDDQGVCLAQEPLKFVVRKSGIRLQCNPLGAREVGRGNNPGLLDEFGELFAATLEREADFHRLERRDREHLAAHFEHQIVLPLDLLGGTGQGKQEFP